MLGTLLPRQSSEGGKKQFVRNWQSEFLQFNVRNIGIAHRQSRQNNFPTMQPHNTKYSAQVIIGYCPFSPVNEDKQEYNGIKLI